MGIEHEMDSTIGGPTPKLKTQNETKTLAWALAKVSGDPDAAEAILPPGKTNGRVHRILPDLAEK